VSEKNEKANCIESNVEIKWKIQNKNELQARHSFSALLLPFLVPEID